VRGGLGYDWSDVGVITNVQLDHIGQDGIRTLEDLVHIKSLVAERVREGGTLVLNADDPHVASLATAPRIASVRREVSYFSRFPNHVRIRSHLSAGGRAYYPRNGWIVEEQSGTRTPVVAISDIPVTRRGAAQFNVANALAAVAAVRAVGVDVGVVARALTTFTDAANPGRVNVFRVGDAQVIVDYGHNPHAFTAMGLLTASWPASRVTAVIAVPGDRADSVIEEAGRAAARAFDRFIVKEDDDPRGRARHEISRRLCEAIQRERPGRECQVVLDEREALTRALRDAQPRELVVVFYDDYEAVMEVLRVHGAEAASVPAAAPDDRRDSSERGDVQVEAYAEADRAAR